MLTSSFGMTKGVFCFFPLVFFFFGGGSFCLFVCFGDFFGETVYFLESRFPVLGRSFTTVNGAKRML